MRKSKKTKIYKIDKNDIILRPYRTRKHEFFREFYNLNKKGLFMKNNKFYIGLAILGFATQSFAYLCGSQLNTQTLANFNAFGMTSLFLAFIGFAFNVNQENERNNRDNEDFIADNRRDFDAVYRYIDDMHRDACQQIDEKCRYSKK